MPSELTYRIEIPDSNITPLAVAFCLNDFLIIGFYRMKQLAFLFYIAISSAAFAQIRGLDPESPPSKPAATPAATPNWVSSMSQPMRRINGEVWKIEDGGRSLIVIVNKNNPQWTSFFRLKGLSGVSEGICIQGNGILRGKGKWTDDRGKEHSVEVYEWRGGSFR